VKWHLWCLDLNTLTKAWMKSTLMITVASNSIWCKRKTWWSCLQIWIRCQDKCPIIIINKPTIKMSTMMKMLASTSLWSCKIYLNQTQLSIRTLFMHRSRPCSMMRRKMTVTILIIPNIKTQVNTKTVLNSLKSNFISLMTKIYSSIAEVN
jgi:hypothetical protein